MKYFLILLMFLVSCGKPIPAIPNDVLAELQEDSSQMFNMSGDIDTYMVRNFERHVQKKKAGETVLIYIFSDGGEVDSAESIINRMSGFRTICVADSAFSAAFEIYQHCTVRVYMSRTALMTHHHYIVFNQNSVVTTPELLLQGLSAYIQEVGLLTRCAMRMGLTYSQMVQKIADNGGEWYIYGDDIVKHRAADYNIKEYQLLKKAK